MVPGGKHDKETGMMLVPEFIKWLRPKLEPYSPK